ncbi:MAG: class I SAM-dependent methyltransferase [Armatimonadetes bacterium]|nr:class I SAM-dependent methyltransferase [Armatimonadota bacterium]
MIDPLEHRKHAARLANRARESSEPTRWFEELYAYAQGQSERVPWADLAPHPLLSEWAAGRSMQWENAAIVGCGLGDDAELISTIAKQVWAFDISSTAIDWAKERFPNSTVSYEVADLSKVDASKFGQFDLVVEVYTWQASPPEIRQEFIENTAKLVEPGGTLVAITRLRTPDDELGPVPWPLLVDELETLSKCGLTETERTAWSPGEPVRSIWKR